MALANIGDCGFRDSCVPLKGKSEWGMDTLTRRFIGARSLAEAFNATLEQGQIFQGYNLQTWNWDDDPVRATVTLTYKGLLAGGTPTPKTETQIMPASGSASVSFATENGGIGRAYRIIPLYSAPLFDDPNPQTVAARRVVYAVGAQVEFTFNAVQTVYNYISVGRPDVPRYEHVQSSFEPEIIEARGITADGSNFGKTGGLFTSFNIQIIERVIGFTVTEVIGSPYFECQDVIRKELGIPPPIL